MAKYRKKPVVIEAIQLNTEYSDENMNEVCSFIGSKNFRVANMDPLDAFIVIVTLEGDIKASPGDYIIKGVKGEFYPCKPDIFEQTYEPVTEDDERFAKVVRAFDSKGNLVPMFPGMDGKTT
jgi:hypothetical protein